MHAKILTIGARGQITLPQKLRNIFKTNTITIELVDDTHAVISPVADVAGSIAAYKKDGTTDFDQIRQQAWLKENSAFVKRDNHLDGSKEGGE